ncbi:hypothetical protein BC629DRAFT_767287 [Irpex lacteus]|nr:hypothetical protein BC629DRAFT_767287 [Irpex lacteus]
MARLRTLASQYITSSAACHYRQTSSALTFCRRGTSARCNDWGIHRDTKGHTREGHVESSKERAHQIHQKPTRISSRLEDQTPSSPIARNYAPRLLPELFSYWRACRLRQKGAARVRPFALLQYDPPRARWCGCCVGFTAKLRRLPLGGLGVAQT